MGESFDGGDPCSSDGFAAGRRRSSDFRATSRFIEVEARMDYHKGPKPGYEFGISLLGKVLI
jgi:hypothetical protein